MHWPLLSSLWHRETKYLKSLSYLKGFEFFMCTATVVFLIKRKLLIKGVKAQKAAAAASFSPRKQLGSRFYQKLPRKAQLPYLAVRILCPTSPGTEQRGTGISNRTGLELSCKATIQTHKAALIWVFQFESKGRLEPRWSPLWTSEKSKCFSAGCSFSFHSSLLPYKMCLLPLKGKWWRITLPLIASQHKRIYWTPAGIKKVLLTGKQAVINSSKLVSKYLVCRGVISTL